MESIVLSNSSISPLHLDIYRCRDSNCYRILVLVGGSGDTRLSLKPLLENLRRKKFSHNIAVFSFRGREERKEYPATQQVEDLNEVLDYLINDEGMKDISIACTSMGAISTTMVLLNNEYDKYLKKVIYLDPADYSEINETETESSTWTGYDNFEYGMGVVSNRIKDVKGNVQINVVNFTIRNRTPKGYAPSNERGKDNPELKERLNNKMVEAFYVNAPKKNKGQYIEDDTLPHAFLRDGDVKQNVNRITELISELVG